MRNVKLSATKSMATIGLVALNLVVLAGCGGKGKTDMPDYSAYVTLGEYKGLEYTELSTEVTDEDLDEQVQSYLQSWGTYDQLDEGTVKDGDTITLDYVGYCEGQQFEGGSTEGNGTVVTIGSHQYIDDFEEQLIGHKAGEEGIEVNVTFPEDYHDETLAGKDATFICDIHTIYDIQIPTELTDDLVSANTEYDTVNSFMDALRMEYEDYKTTQAEQRRVVDLITGAIGNATITGYPQEEFETLKEKTIQGAMDNAEAQGLYYDDYLATMNDENGNPYTAASYEAAVEAYIKELLDEKMVVCMIADAEGIKVTQQDVEDYVNQEVANSSGLTAQDVYDTYTMKDLAYYVISDRVMDFLTENGVPVKE